MANFGYLSEEGKVSDKARFALPSIFHGLLSAEEKKDGLIIFADVIAKELRITTKEQFETYRNQLIQAARKTLDPQLYKVDDELWRGTFSAAHRKLLGLDSDKASIVKFSGDDWFISVKKPDAEISDEQMAEIKSVMADADEYMLKNMAVKNDKC